MFSCPRCHRVLARMKTESGLLWSCASCEGRAVNLSVLRLRVEKHFMNRMWMDVRQVAEAGKVSNCRCPSCNHAMHPVDVEGLQGLMEIDACDTCQFLWLDKGEGFAMPLLPEEKEEMEKKELDPRLKELMAMHKVELRREEYAREIDNTLPESWWEIGTTLMGLPVEEDRVAFKKFPWATWVTALVILVVSVTAFWTGLGEAIQEYALVPADLFRKSGLTFVTSFLLHGGIWHLVGNLYFLILVGDNVEDFAGKAQFLGILILGALMGDGFHIWLNPTDAMPLIGASGGISALMVYYALQFPRIRLCFCVWFVWFRLSASMALVIWIGLQFFGAWQQALGMSNVSSMAHLGGACMGFFFWFAGRYSRDPQRVG